MALKLNTPTDAEAQTPPPTPAPLPPPPPKPVESVAPPTHHHMLPIVIFVVVLVVIVAAGFVYFNRALLFKKPEPIVVAPMVIVPEAPKELSGVLSGTSAVSLAWMVGSGTETGFRLQRKEGEGTYVPLTSLPAMSTNFLDTTVAPGRTYGYRITAVNEGGESNTSNEVTVSLPEPLPVAPPAPTLPPGGLDSDSDGLSDAEELVFGTDLHNPDTDRDGFLDGNEVFHLYNPSANAPVNLIDSGLVVHANSPSGWSLYVPKNWTVKFDEQNKTGAVIDTGHGERMQIRLENNPNRTPLLDWYLSQHPGTISSAIRSITTKRGLEGVLGPDRLDAYFAWEDKIWTIKYDLNGQTFINYRTLFEMILNSLQLVGAPQVPTPTMDALPGPGALVGSASSTSSNATSSSSEVPPLQAPSSTASIEATTTSTVTPSQP